MRTTKRPPRNPKRAGEAFTMLLGAAVICAIVFYAMYQIGDMP